MPLRNRRQMHAYIYALRKYGVSVPESAAIALRRLREIEKDTPYNIQEDGSIRDASHEWDAKDNE
jgi:hypothetical protein